MFDVPTFEYDRREETSAPRQSQVRSLGELLPLVLARYEARPAVKPAPLSISPAGIAAQLVSAVCG